jgi:O-antigen/teichoic acid export membrane protein
MLTHRPHREAQCDKIESENTVKEVPDDKTMEARDCDPAGFSRAFSVPRQRDIRAAGVSTMLSSVESLWAWLRSENSQRRSRVLLVYFTGQGLVQFTNLLTGLLLLRWLTVDNYAQFIVAFSFQATLGFLTDLGFSGTIVALVGPRGNDPAVIGSYIRSGRRIRNVMLLCLTPVAALIYVQIVRQHHWATWTSVILFASIVASIYFSGMISYYGAPLLIHGRLSHYYRNQLAGSLFRILISGALYLIGFLSAWTASWINALGFLVIGWLNVHESRRFVELPTHLDPKTTRQMMHYVLPSLPSLIFFALQGQISLFLISFFGRTQSIAEVGALGRLGQLFLLLSGFNAAVIEPFMARLPQQRVLRSYLTIALIASAICVPVCSVGFMYPKLPLLLLGPKYASLNRETGWLILSSCIGYLIGLLTLMNAARRWIYWTTSLTDIGVVIAAQILFLCRFKVDTTINAILFGLATNAAYLAATIFNSVYGFIHGPKIRIDDAASALHATPQSSIIEQIADQ